LNAKFPHFLVAILFPRTVEFPKAYKQTNKKYVEMATTAAEIIEGTNFNIQFVLEQIVRNVNGTNGNGINGGGGILENLGAFETIVRINGQ
jgi:hypothetical protein